METKKIRVTKGIAGTGVLAGAIGEKVGDRNPGIMVKVKGFPWDIHLRPSEFEYVEEEKKDETEVLS